MSSTAPAKRSRSAIILTALLILFIAVFLVSSVMLISYIINSSDEARLYEQNENLNSLSELFNFTSAAPDNTDPIIPTDPAESTTGSPDVSSSTELTATVPTVTEPDLPQYSERLTAVRENIFELQKINPDIVGYISIPSLDLGYPLLSRRTDTENSFYLKKAYDLSEAASGSIYYDYRCDPNPQNNRNTVIYGHNMRNGSMFGKLPRCVNSESEFHRAEIIIATLEGVYTYKLFSVYRTNSSENYCRTSFANDAEFNSFYTQVKERSLFKANYSPSSAQSIITFSTCTNLTQDGRYALHAILTRIER